MQFSAMTMNMFFPDNDDPKDDHGDLPPSEWSI